MQYLIKHQIYSWIIGPYLGPNRVLCRVFIYSLVILSVCEIEICNSITRLHRKYYVTIISGRFRPHQNAVVVIYNGVFFLICTVFVRQFYIPILIFSNNARSLSSEMFDKTGRT